MNLPSLNNGKRSVRRTLGALVVALIAVVSTVPAQSQDDLTKRIIKEMRHGNYEQAESLCRRILATDESDVGARLRLSYVLIKLGRLQAAYDEAARVAVADHRNARARALMGTTLLRTGQFPAAKSHLSYAYALNPRDALALAGLAEVELFENRAEPAYSGLKRAIALESREPDFYRPYARACSRLELYTEAADAFSRFLEVAPKTDEKQRARIEGVIRFYRRIGNRKLNVVSGDRVTKLHIDVIGNRPFLDVMVNGKGPLRFVLDTGASFSLISDEAAKRLGISPIASGGDGRAIGGSGSFPLVYSLLDSIVIGGAKIENVPVYIRTIHQPSDVRPEEKYDGYLGLSLMANYLVTIDYKERTLLLDRRESTEDPQVAASDSTVQIPIRTTRDGLASAETRLETLEEPLNFIVDTGASVTVVSKAVVRQNNLQNLIIPDQRIQVVGAAGIDDNVEALRLDAITVDCLRKTSTRAVILAMSVINEDTGFEQHGILGGDFLRHFKVQFDLRRYVLSLTPQNSQIQLVRSEPQKQ
jgi:predicted aspartyl protease/Flp pilus assembly protein TadD